MKVVSWNVNSLKARAELVGLYLDHEQPDVLCIQELKLAAEKVPLGLFEERGYHVALHAQSQWNGVLIASKQPIEDVHQGLPDGEEGQARMVVGTVPLRGQAAGLRLVNLYCPQGQTEDSPKFAYKLRFYDALVTWLEGAAAQSTPLVVVGDLNVAPGPDDIWDPERFASVPSFHPREHEAWRRIEGLGLVDAVRPHIAPRTYSYWDYRAGCFHKKQGMRIDHVLVSEALVPRVRTAWIRRDWRKKKQGLTPSDHAPVGVELD